jgi:hypothetical protein
VTHQLEELQAKVSQWMEVSQWLEELQALFLHHQLEEVMMWDNYH